MNTSFSQTYRYEYRQWYTGHNFSMAKVMELAIAKYGERIALRNAYRVLNACESIRREMDEAQQVQRHD